MERSEETWKRTHIVRGLRQQQELAALDAYMTPLTDRGWDEGDAYLAAMDLADHLADLVVDALTERNDLEIWWVGNDLHIVAESKRTAEQEYQREVFDAETVIAERFERVLRGTDNGREAH